MGIYPIPADFYGLLPGGYMYRPGSRPGSKEKFKLQGYAPAILPEFKKERRG